MSEDSNLRTGFCIYIDTLCQGSVPVVSDENGYIVFETKLEAQKEIVDNQMTRLRQFLDGERDYEDESQSKHTHSLRPAASYWASRSLPK